MNVYTIIISLCDVILAHVFLQKGTRTKTTRPKEKRGETEYTRVCHSVMKVSEIGLKRSECHQCLKKNRKIMKFSSFVCSECRVRLCETACFAKYHQTLITTLCVYYMYVYMHIK